MFFTASGVQAQIYRGTIDRFPVIFQVSEDEYNDYAARYYYLSSKINIMLYWMNDDSTVLETRAGKDGQKEEFRLRQTGNKLTGTWRYRNKTLNVNLVYDTTLSSYSDPKFEGMKMQKLGDENYDASTVLTWYKEPITGIECFRVKSSTKIRDIKKMNAFLKRQHMDAVQESIRCVDGSPHGGEYNASCRISFLSNELMSLVWSEGYYCGGAHPDGGEKAVTVDVNTLRQINLRDLYWISTEGYQQIDDDYNMPGFNSTWQALLNKQYPGEYPRHTSVDENGSGCIYNADAWSNSTWYLTPAGLYMSSFFPRVARCCDTSNGDPYVSYKLLEKYRVKTNMYVLK